MEHNFIHYHNSLGRRYCTIRYMEENKILSLIWKGTATEESIKEVEQGVLQMLRKYDCRGIVNDVQEFFNAPTGFLSALTKQVWDKKVVSTSDVQVIAHVLPPDDILPSPVPYSTESPEIRYFPNKLDALEWVNNSLKN
ncbi:hypothetical protein [Pontibacter ruber]|uniref:STAS/SEC14 domain-containing protein n=1 Tax=Pontibacter ruber TaxID=1343895 RepID=A0ABW5D1V4_9BACT|nr:hypothetical protein [Pontibacter ruber]